MLFFSLINLYWLTYFGLQIYSSPSDLCHAHVDTPRGPRQFGSLVVCLPCAHEGDFLNLTADFELHQALVETILLSAFRSRYQNIEADECLVL